MRKKKIKFGIFNIKMKKKTSFTINKTTNTSHINTRKISESSLIKTQNNANSTLIDELKLFENMRAQLLQWHLLNSEIDEKMKIQASKLEVF